MLQQEDQLHQFADPAPARKDHAEAGEAVRGEVVADEGGGAWAEVAGGAGVQRVLVVKEERGATSSYKCLIVLVLVCMVFSAVFHRLLLSLPNQPKQLEAAALVPDHHLDQRQIRLLAPDDQRRSAVQRIDLQLAPAAAVAAVDLVNVLQVDQRQVVKEGGHRQVGQIGQLLRRRLGHSLLFLGFSFGSISIFLLFGV